MDPCARATRSLVASVQPRARGAAASRIPSGWLLAPPLQSALVRTMAQMTGDAGTER